VELNIRLKPDHPWCSLYFPYPQTELGEYAKDNNLIEGKIDKFSYSFFYRSALRLKQKKEISNLQKLFFYAVKLPILFPLIKLLIKGVLPKFRFGNSPCSTSEVDYP